MSNIEVANLYYYPIKSCAATEADEVAVNEFGIDHDREWMLVGAKGQFLSQRTHPELALVQTRITHNQLVITAPRVGELALSLDRDPAAQEVPITLWRKPGSGTHEGAEAAAYFSDYLKKDARLLRIRQPRQINPDLQVPGAATRTAFADGFPLLLASTSSLASLNGHMERPVTIDRFRPNIVVTGASAYEEDSWRELRIGRLQAFVVLACARCPVPNIDQQVGVLPEPKDRAVTQALRATRAGINLADGDDGEFFGQNVVHVFEPGTSVRVGDPVTVVNKDSEPNWRPL